MASVGMTSLSSSGCNAHAGQNASNPRSLTGTQHTLPARSTASSPSASPSASHTGGVGQPGRSVAWAFGASLASAFSSFAFARRASRTAFGTRPPNPRVMNGSTSTCSTLRRSRYPAACSRFTCLSNRRRNSPRGTKPRRTGASEQSGSALRPRHASPPPGASPTGASPYLAVPNTTGLWSMFQHASGHPEAAHRASVTTSDTGAGFTDPTAPALPSLTPQLTRLGSTRQPPIDALGPPGQGIVNLTPSPSRANLRSYGFASRSPIHRD